MSNATQALLVLGAVLIVSMILALRARQRSSAHGTDTSLVSWSLADRRFGTWLVFVLMAGEIYTTFTFLGGSGWIYGRGAPAYYMLTGGTVAYISSYWLLPAIWRRATAWRVLTQPEFFARAYESARFGKLVSIVSILALMPYLILQLRGLGIIVSETSFGAISANVAVLWGLIVVTLYVVLTGIRGSAHVAAFKDVLVLATALGLGVFLPQQLFGGVTPMFDRLTMERPELLTLPPRGYSGVWYASTVFLTGIGFFLWPHAFSAALTARSERSLRRNAVLMPLYQLMLVAVFLIGFAAVLIVPGLRGNDVDLALIRLVRETLPAWLVGVVGAAGLLTALVPGSLILITMATIGAQLITASDDTRGKRTAQWLVPVFAILALLGAWFGGQELVALLLLAYAVVVQLVPAMLCAVFATGAVSAAAVTAGLSVGEAVVVADLLSDHSLLPRVEPWVGSFADVNIGVLALIANAVIVGVITGLIRMRRR